MVGSEIWEHLNDPRILVKQSLDHLKEGGMFIFSLPYGVMINGEDHVKEYYLDDVKKILTEFKEIDSFEVTRPGESLFIIAKGFKK